MVCANGYSYRLRRTNHLKGPIQSLEVSYFLHATEDPAKVGAAVSELVSFDDETRVEEMEGHYGNRILWVRLRLTGENATEAFGRISERLGEALKKDLLSTMSDHVDEHSVLFLRFDKQKLVSGELSFADSDAVRIRIKPRAFLKRGTGPQFYVRLIGGD
jgi:RNA binding exosome subunit